MTVKGNECSDTCIHNNNASIESSQDDDDDDKEVILKGRRKRSRIDVDIGKDNYELQRQW